MNIKQMIAKGLLISLMAGAVTGCSADREKNIVFNSAQEEPPQTNLTFFGFKYEALNVMAIEESLHGFMDRYPDISISYDGIKERDILTFLKRGWLPAMGMIYSWWIMKECWNWGDRGNWLICPDSRLLKISVIWP